MLTPNDLDKLEFEKGMFGSFKRDSVEENFNMLKNDYEALYKENIYLKDKLSMMDGLVSKYKALEDSMQNALIVAQTTADQMIKSAADKAENILKEAEVRSKEMELEANNNLQAIRIKQVEIKQDCANFAARMVAGLKAQIEILTEFDYPHAEHNSMEKKFDNPVLFNAVSEYEDNFFDDKDGN